MNIIDVIYQEMQSDQESTDKSSEYLLDWYNNASAQERAGVDETLVTICGWSMETLIKMAKNDGINPGMLPY